MLPLFTPTAAQQAHYRALAHELLDSTLRDYDAFRNQHGRQMNHKLWKRVKTRENLTVYKERDPTPLQHCPAAGPDWVDPKLLVTTGTIVGDLDDAMFGHLAIDGASMLLKAAITKSRMSGGALLAQIEGPSIEDPFHFLGVKWIAAAPPTILNGIIWSRDLIAIEAMGVVRLPNGERIGYQIIKSITLPGVGTLEHESIVRERVCACRLFRQVANRTIDVYLKGYVDALGKVSDSFALNAAARGFATSWNSSGCAQYKKLLWLVQQKQQRQTGKPRALERSTACATCSKKFGTFSHGEICHLCDTTVCSRCRVNWTLYEVDDQELNLHERDATMCKSCITSASQQDPLEVIKQEIRSGRFATPPADTDVKLWSFHGKREGKPRKTRTSSFQLVKDVDIRGREDGDQHSAQSLKSSPQPVSRRHTHTDPVHTTANNNSLSGYTLSTDSEPPSSSFAPISLDEPDNLARSLPLHHHDLLQSDSAHERRDTDEDLEVDSNGDDDEVHQGGFVDYYTTGTGHFHYSGAAISDAPSLKEQQQQRLWAQLVALRVASESTYQMTLQTADAHNVRRKC